MSSQSSFLRWCGLLVAILATTNAPAATEAASLSTPNVFLIMTNDQGYGDLSCHRNPFLKTPNQDQLHAECVRLTNDHASPLRGTTLTALLTQHHCRNVAFQSNPPPRDLNSREPPTIANVFAANVYRTGIFGKWHLGRLYPHRVIDQEFTEVVVHGGGAITTVGDIWGYDYFNARYFHNAKKTQSKGFCTGVFFNTSNSVHPLLQDSGQTVLLLYPDQYLPRPPLCVRRIRQDV